MSFRDHHDDDARDEEILDEEVQTREPEAGTDQRAAGIGTAAWIGSAATHATALALMGLIYWSVTDEQKLELPPTVSISRPELPKPKPPETTPNEPITDNRTLLLEQVADEVQVPTPLDQLVIEEPGEEDADPELPPAVKGDSAALSDIDMGSTGLFNTIGIGTGDAGKHGTKIGGKGLRGVKRKIGVPRFVVDGTASALRWFWRHQSPNGMWDADGYFRNCTDAGPKCEPGKDQSGETDFATTGYAVLCFLADGIDQTTPHRYRNTVRKGLEWLVANQKPDGLLGARNYEHAIATMALAQAYAMSPEPWLREPAQRAVDVLLARQNRDPSATAPYDRLGWDYVNPSGRNDASVTGWCVMALKSAYAGGLKVGDGLEGSKAWLEKSWKAANTDQPWCADPGRLDPYTGISRFGYVWKTGAKEVEISAWAGDRPTTTANHDLAPVGLMSAVFLGHKAGDPMLESLANYVTRYHLPTAWPCNTYYLYYTVPCDETPQSPLRVMG